MLDVGIDVTSSRDAVDRAANRDGVFASAGLHPNDCAEHATQLPEIEALARGDGTVAVGETGLDLYWDRVPLPVQIESLEHHLGLAAEIGKPVILHCRDAFGELFEVLTGHAPVHGVLHCFTAGIEEARRCLELGLMVSFAGPVTYPKNDMLREAAAFVPADRLLVETDAPFLPPQSRRGERNEPALIVETVRGVARARGIEFEEAAALTWGNACDLFASGPAPA